MKLDSFKKFLFSKKGVYLCLALIFIGLFVINYFTIWAADDYANYNSVWTHANKFSFGVIFNNTMELYFGQTGRFLSTFLNRIFLYFDKNIFNIFNSLIYTLLVFVIYKIVKKNNEENAWLVCLIFLFTWLFVPAIGQVMFWQIGSVIYLWMFFLVALVTLLYTKLLKNIKLKTSFFKNTLIFILTILAGNGLETNTVILLVYIGLIFLYKIIIKKEHIPLWAWIGLVGTILGFATNFFAPGNMVRMNSMTSGIGDTLFLKILHGGGFLVYNGLFRSKIYQLLVILIVVYCIYLISQKTKHKFQLNKNILIPFTLLAIFLGSFLTVMLIMYPTNYPGFIAWFWDNVYKFWYIIALIAFPLIIAIIYIIINHKIFFKDTNKTNNSLILFLSLSALVGIAAYILVPTSWPRSYMGMSLYLIIAIIYVLTRIKYKFKYLKTLVFTGMSLVFITTYVILLKDVYLAKKWEIETKDIIQNKISNNEEEIYVKTFISTNPWNAASAEKWVIPIHMEEGYITQNYLPIDYEWINIEITNYYFNSNNAWYEGKRIKGISN